jgi:hypothetical protein
MVGRIARFLGPRWLAAIGLALICLIIVLAAGAGSTAGAFAALYLVFFVIGAIIGIPASIYMRSRRHRALAKAIASDESGYRSQGADYVEEEVEPNMGAIWVAAAAAALAIISVFLPRVESDTFFRVQDNTLIQSGDGWVIIGCAIGIAGAAYRAHRDRTRTWAVLVLGLIVIGFAYYSGSGDRLELESAGSVLGERITDKASPGVGIYAAGAAGVLAVFSGWALAGGGGTAFETNTEHRTKTCPECAETVLAEARVCKHCGYRFAPPAGSEAPEAARDPGDLEDQRRM